MKKLKILSAILVLIGVAMVGVGGISTTQTQDFNGVQNSKLNLRAIKVNKLIKVEKPVKPLYNVYEYLRVKDVSFDPGQELVAGDPVTIYLTVKNEGAYDLTDGVVFRMRFGVARVNQNNVACVDAPDLGYTCKEFSDGVKYIEYTWDSWAKDEVKIIPVRMYITEDAPYDIKQTPEWYGFAKGDLSEYYIHHYPELDGIYLYRAYGPFHVKEKLKVYVQPNIYDVGPNGGIVYSVKVKNFDTAFNAEDVKVKLGAFDSTKVTCYAVLLYPNKVISCDDLINKEISLGDIPANSEGLIGFIYTKINDNVVVGEKIGNIFMRDPIDDSIGEVHVSNATTLDYQNGFGPVWGIQDYVTVRLVDNPPHAIPNTTQESPIKEVSGSKDGKAISNLIRTSK